MSEKRLVRVQDDRVILGVAAGLARYVNIDPVLVRLFFVLLTLSTGYGPLIYLLLALLMPAEGVIAKANSFDSEEIVIKDAV
ncbi:MAG: PspC domain-containing protein [Chloroflexi bacterium]|nr:PspC domain-containing protein [Chloroflexota bacterium]MCI0580575.1 PspC domain-containing protein [Chloroflexota bacterium]MCI0643545.1 PspC domain-containing protein [Chloroflexota bacterium]MCI0727941.1 PspC domain-containing protein [Chloroflexota bacterium]